MKPDRDETQRFRTLFPRLARAIEQCDKQDLNHADMTLYERVMLKAYMPISDYSTFWLGRIEMIKRHFNVRTLEELNGRIEHIAAGLEAVLQEKENTIGTEQAL